MLHQICRPHDLYARCACSDLRGEAPYSFTSMPKNATMLDDEGIRGFGKSVGMYLRLCRIGSLLGLQLLSILHQAPQALLIARVHA
jgi:hypothetical protein